MKPGEGATTQERSIFFKMQALEELCKESLKRPVSIEKIKRAIMASLEVAKEIQTDISRLEDK